MKTPSHIAAALVCLFSAIMVASPTPLAGAEDVEIRASRTKVDQQTERSKANMTVKRTEVAYDIEITNKTFTDMTNLEIHYMIFYEVSKAGSTTKPVEKFVAATEKVDDIPAHKKATMTTKAVEIKSAELDPGWEWNSGASNKSRDRVVGIWCRLYRNGEMLAEYINPSSLSRRHQWQGGN